MSDDYPKKGDVYWVRLDPTDEKEIKKTHPCLVISSDIANQSDLIVIAPITSNVDKVFARIEVKISLNGIPGKILPRQMRAVDRTKRLGNKIASLSSQEMKAVDDATRLILGLI